MIPYRRWYYLPLKKLSSLLRRITSNHDGDFYCLNCFHSFRTKNKLESHKKKYVKITIFEILQCLLRALGY